MSTLNARKHDLATELNLTPDGKVTNWELNLNFLQSAYTEGANLNLHFISGQVVKYRAESEQLATEALERIWLLAGTC